MARITVSARMDVELVEWVDGYAKARRCSRTDVLELAVRELRDAAQGGVPELPTELPVRRESGSSAGQERAERFRQATQHHSS